MILPQCVVQYLSLNSVATGLEAALGNRARQHLGGIPQVMDYHYSYFYFLRVAK